MAVDKDSLKDFLAGFLIPLKYLPVYVLLFVYFIYAGWRYSQSEGEYSTIVWVVHGVFHEVGHAVTRWAGETVCVLSGTVFQILTPIACGIYFCFSREKHAALMTVGWLGFTLIDAAAYMRDAIEMKLQLVAPFASGEDLIHDWNWLFSHWGILRHSDAIGNIVAALGWTALCVSLLLMLVAASPWHWHDSSKSASETNIF